MLITGGILHKIMYYFMSLRARILQITTGCIFKNDPYLCNNEEGIFNWKKRYHLQYTYYCTSSESITIRKLVVNAY